MVDSHEGAEVDRVVVEGADDQPIYFNGRKGAQGVPEVAEHEEPVDGRQVDDGDSFP